MLRPSLFVFSHMIALAIALMFLPAIASSDPNPEAISILVPYDDTPIGGRMPLILVHGIWGNRWDNGIDDRNSPHWPYWQELQNFYYLWDQSDLRSKYKLYAFWYESDELPVMDIAQGLSYWIDQRTAQGILPSTPLVLLAHSMGGLVSRSMIENHEDEGASLVHKLITLSTPHLGSPIEILR
ncbi:MAG: hypothetical protein EOM24_19555, partial [Chloroflexia bacterium]|nr:hypothetical protein [Chloroflexia bacterium]